MENYWSQYWKQGKLHSFADAIGQNYEGELAQRWLTFFNTFSATRATLVDVGCGNGALIELALRTPDMDNVTLIGVDTAKLSIPHSLERAQVTFLQNTSAEKTGLDDACVDAVVSQFGIEYSDIDVAIEEVSRILKADGKFNVIVHDEESTIIKRNAKTLKAVKVLSVQDQALAALRKLINALHKYGKQTPVAEQARHGLNQAIEGLVNQFGQQAVVDTNFPALVKSVLAPTMTHSNKKIAVKTFERELKAHEMRLQELVSAAFTGSKKEHLEQQLKKLGFRDIAMNPVKDNGRLIGCEIFAVKS